MNNLDWSNIHIFNYIFDRYNVYYKDKYNEVINKEYNKEDELILIRELLSERCDNKNVYEIKNVKEILKEYEDKIKKRLDIKRSIIEKNNVKQNLWNWDNGSFNIENNYKWEVWELLVARLLKWRNNVNCLWKSDLFVSYKNKKIDIQVKTIFSDLNAIDLVKNNYYTFDLQENQVRWNEWIVVVILSTDYNHAWIMLSENLHGSEIKKNYSVWNHIPKTKNEWWKNYNWKNYSVKWKELVTIRISPKIKKVEDEVKTFTWQNSHYNRNNQETVYKYLNNLK